jgi:predicted nucleotidyltransferase
MTDTKDVDLLVDYLRLKKILNISLDVDSYLDELNKLSSDLELIKPDFTKNFEKAIDLE